MAQRVRTVIFFFMSFAVSNVEPLLNDFIRSRQHIRRNRQADLLGGFEVDHELEPLVAPQEDQRALCPFRILSTYTAIALE